MFFFTINDLKHKIAKYFPLKLYYSKIFSIVWESEIESARSGKVFDVFWENEVNKQTVINWVLSKEVEDLVMPVYLEILNTRYDYG